MLPRHMAVPAACSPPRSRPWLRCIRADPFTAAHTYELHGVDGPLLSAIRHAVVKDVSCLALDRLVLMKCTSPWEQEFIALRMGQVPVAGVDATTGAAVDGDGAMFDAHVTAPAPEDRPCEFTIVCSGDFRPFAGPAGAAAPKAALVHARSRAEAHLAGRGFQVVLLQPGQEAHLRAVAHRGTGRQGTRWKCVHVTQMQGPPHAVKVLTLETTGAVTAPEALRLALQATEARLRAAAASI